MRTRPFELFRWQRSLYMEKYLNSLLMENTRVAEQPIRLDTLTSRLKDRAMDFILSSSSPFALFLSFPNAHTPLVPGRAFRGVSAHGSYGDSVAEMDAAVGEVLAALEAAGKAGDTMVYFASDHGTHVDLGDKGGSNRPYSGEEGFF